MNDKNKRRSLRRAARYIISATFLFVAWILWSCSDNRETFHPPRTADNPSQPCIELRPLTATHQDAVVNQSALYCVGADFWQRRLHGAGHSWPGTSHELIAVAASNTTIDLNNHTLHSDGHSAGIRVNLDAKNWGRTKTITVKNGVIDLRGMGTGVESHHKWDMFLIDEPPPSGIIGYDEPRLVLENLLIKTDNIGIVLTGEGNIIRNCVIESGGNGAVMMAGPNGQILNNTIILADPFIPGDQRGHDFSQPRHFSELFEARSEPKAAIVLHQATGTVISGNRIEVKGKSPTRHNIYLTDASENVRIEGNTFVGAEDPVTLVKGSTATMKNNVFEQRKPWWKF